MWLRDSTNQVVNYVRSDLLQDTSLRGLIEGLINAQAEFIAFDPYANAFMVDPMMPLPHADDSTYRTIYAGVQVNAMNYPVFERKYELDSTANFLLLSAKYFNATGDSGIFYHGSWLSAVGQILDVYVSQQRDTLTEDLNGGPDYWFQRSTSQPSDSLEHGRGFPCRYTGMIKTAFRASDDAAVYAFNIPENAFTAVALESVAVLLDAMGASDYSARALVIASQVRKGIQQFGTMVHPILKQTVYAYEVDGYGNAIFMDDANMPSLLSLPLFFTAKDDPVYLATRAGLLSDLNPYFFNGTVASGIGGPHAGLYNIWPMAIAVQAMTSTSETEITQLLQVLVDSSACTGLIHESFSMDDFTQYTRDWFAWANSVFAEFIIKMYEERPWILDRVFSLSK